MPDTNVDLIDIQALYQENISPIFRYVYSKVRNREDAEDLTSQIFMKAIRGVDYKRDIQSVQKWLFQVARTTIADYWRAYYRIRTFSMETLLEAGWEGPTQEVTITIETERTDRVRLILEVLPERDREVLTCRFLLNLSVRETALRMGVTESNVKVLQYRALKRAANLEPIVADSVSVT